jgi:hypothetical protein
VVERPGDAGRVREVTVAREAHDVEVRQAADRGLRRGRVRGAWFRH